MQLFMIVELEHDWFACSSIWFNLTQTAVMTQLLQWYCPNLWPLQEQESTAELSMKTQQSFIMIIQSATSTYSVTASPTAVCCHVRESHWANGITGITGCGVKREATAHFPPTIQHDEALTCMLKVTNAAALWPPAPTPAQPGARSTVTAAAASQTLMLLLPTTNILCFNSHLAMLVTVTVSEWLYDDRAHRGDGQRY